MAFSHMYTFAIIKPTSVSKKESDGILALIKKSGFEIAEQKGKQLSSEEVKALYSVHESRPFFDSLCLYMQSSPVILLILKGENAVIRFRDLMGATDPKNATEGTIRHKFGSSIEDNAVHGSDTIESAEKEMSLFFPDFVNQHCHTCA